jgi:hypothetical protein
MLKDYVDVKLKLGDNDAAGKAATIMTAIIREK